MGGKGAVWLNPETRKDRAWLLDAGRKMEAMLGRSGDHVYKDC